MTSFLSDPRKSGFLLALVGTFLFSSKGIFVKLAYQYGIDTVTLLALRMLFSLPFYVILLVWSVRKMNAETKAASLQVSVLAKISFLGILGYYIASFLDLEAMHFISVQLERLVLLTYPIFVALLSWVFFKERLTGNILLALLLSYSGIAILVGYDFSQQINLVWGSLLVVLAAFSFALYFTFAKIQIKISGSVFFTCIAMMAAAFGLLVHFFIKHDFTDLFVRKELLVLGGILAVFCTVLPSLLMTEAIARIGSVSSAMIGSAGPIFTAIMAVMILNEPFTIYHILGMVLTLSGIYVLGQKSIKSAD